MSFILFQIGKGKTLEQSDSNVHRLFPICLSSGSSSFLYEVDKVSVFSSVRKRGSERAVGNRCALVDIPTVALWL